MAVRLPASLTEATATPMATFDEVAGLAVAAATGAAVAELARAKGRIKLDS